MQEDKKPIWLRLLIPTGIGLLIALLYMLLEGVFQQPDRLLRLKGISDGFLLPGVLWFCFGAISFVSSKGFFDLFSYATFNLFGFFRPKKEDSERAKAKDLYEYKKAKDERGRKCFPFVFVSGILFIILSIVFAVIRNR